MGSEMCIRDRECDEHEPLRSVEEGVHRSRSSQVEDLLASFTEFLLAVAWSVLMVKFVDCLHVERGGSVRPLISAGQKSMW